MGTKRQSEKVQLKFTTAYQDEVQVNLLRKLISKEESPTKVRSLATQLTAAIRKRDEGLSQIDRIVRSGTVLQLVTFDGVKVAEGTVFAFNPKKGTIALRQVGSTSNQSLLGHKFVECIRKQPSQEENDRGYYGTEDLLTINVLSAA